MANAASDNDAQKNAKYKLDPFEFWYANVEMVILKPLGVMAVGYILDPGTATIVAGYLLCHCYKNLKTIHHQIIAQSLNDPFLKTVNDLGPPAKHSSQTLQL